MSQQQWKLRVARNKDIPFLFSSWLKSFRDAPSMTALTNTTYYDKFHRTLESVFQSSAVLVACDPEDEDTVFGYAVAEVKGDTLVFHWVYVKHAFRSFGVGKSLEAEMRKIPHKDVVYTCRTRLSDTLNKSRNYKYDPFYLWSHVK